MSFPKSLCLIVSFLAVSACQSESEKRQEAAQKLLDFSSESFLDFSNFLDSGDQSNASSIRNNLEGSLMAFDNEHFEGSGCSFNIILLCDRARMSRGGYGVNLPEVNIFFEAYDILDRMRNALRDAGGANEPSNGAGLLPPSSN